MPDIVTVTVNYKMREKVLDILRSLFRDLEGSALTVQPVVVDNASQDGIAEALQSEFGPRVICLSSERNLGFGRANNLALRMLPARYYFLANPDIFFLETQPRALPRMYEFMEEHPKIGMLAPRLLYPDGTLQSSCLRFPGFLDHPAYRLGWHEKYAWARQRVARLHLREFDHQGTQPIDWATGAALFIRGDLLKEVGFFDERYFMYFEDTDLCRAFWSRGYPVYYKGDIVLQHGHERASAKVPGLRAVLANPLTRIHLASWLKYTWKWKGDKF